MGLKFDFNNMFSANIGDQGVSDADIAEILVDAQKADKHLKDVLNNKLNRINLSLEWSQLPLQDKQEIVKIQKLGREISRKFENVLFLGIGGSYLGLKAAQDALASPYYNEFKSLRKRSARVYFEGNNLDPDTLSALLKNLQPKKTFVVVISKSGETKIGRAHV